MQARFTCVELRKGDPFTRIDRAKIMRGTKIRIQMCGVNWNPWHRAIYDGEL